MLIPLKRRNIRKINNQAIPDSYTSSQEIYRLNYQTNTFIVWSIK
ncbi:hypothetical protein [Chryseobacterium sp. P1-3]|nr:hypothetical protein [Chryseobacterium sp. P1-3]